MSEADQQHLVRARELAKLFGPLHNVSYYAPEIRDFTKTGVQGWWNGYFVYRAAPMGPVPVEVVVAAFYNFAPRMIAKSLPANWQVVSPTQALELRLELVDRALRRMLGEGRGSAEVRDAATLARRAIEPCDGVGRVLYNAYAGLAWPDEPHLALWHACTLLREHRGDNHNIALAAAEIDGVECHVLMAGMGHGNRASILPIRGWTDEEWSAAVGRLGERGWARPDGTLTDAGQATRRAIEEHTNRLSAGPSRNLGTEGADRLISLLEPIVKVLHEQGGVPTQWPPPHLMRPQN
ncbi:MAG: hypothetical protein QOJ19_486 [Acidimicrobiia bacterium]|nr:hypothetical protein [Acidimicrobiia bacterium]